jgi:hypothetical protein
MRKRAIVPLVAVVLAGLTASCQKLDRPTPVNGGLTFAPAEFADAIPAAYGQLVSVTPSTDPYGAVMWFRKSDESIVVLRINYVRGALGTQVIEIPRK